MAEINKELATNTVEPPVNNAEINQAKQYQSWDVGILNIQRGNDVLKEASETPDPKKLYDSLWYEGEVGCCFADTGSGKSIYVVQIADKVANSGNIVLYFDFELTKKQFELRYSDENRHLHQFSTNFYRVEINPDSLKDTVNGSFESELMESIEKAILITKAKVLIIDNLTYLCLNSEKGDAAGHLMMQLMGFKKIYGLSMLVLAHTPKRLLDTPITQNNLAGSKRLMNFFDSVFAIGKSAKDGGLRYVKQIKVRYGEFTYDENNVLVYEIEKQDAFTQFIFKGYSTEREHLKQLTEDDEAQLESQVKDLLDKKWHYRSIAEKLGRSKSWVGKIAGRFKQK